MAIEILFGAEADRIQVTLFRAERLRQVIGGSRLIAEFGEVAAEIAREHGATGVPVKAGGNLIAVFPAEKEESAARFGQLLADSYRELLEASLTLSVESIPTSAEFGQANEKLHQVINWRKGAERGQQASEQTPTTAFCKSSGSGLAADMVPSRDRQAASSLARFDYVSAAVLRMEEAGQQARDQDEHSFLGKIKNDHLPDYLQDLLWPDKVDEIENLDPSRGNVAYLVADGNGMGELFRKCDSPAQLEALSLALDNALREAIVEPLPDMVSRLEESFDRDLFCLPVLPLILAGDDVFALLPALYSLDYARRFCLAFETAMRARFEEAEILKPLLPFAPTISAAVIICKGSYPYRLAHMRGEARLKQSKQLAKEIRRLTEDRERFSAVSFELITGNELISQVADEELKYRAELRPYWAAETISDTAAKLSFPLALLLEERFMLSGAAGKRLAEFRKLYSPQYLPANDDELKEWRNELIRLLERIIASDPLERLTGEKKPVTQQRLWREALRVLGNGEPPGGKNGVGSWREVQRAGEMFQAHGLPDLIEVWDYAQTLEKTLDDYEGEER